MFGLAAVSCGSPSSTTESQPTTTQPVPTTVAASTSTAETTPRTTTTSVASTTTAAPSPARPAPYWAIPDGMRVAVAGADGVHLLTGNDDRIIDPGLFDDIAADPNGDGWFVADQATIRHLGDDGSNELVVTAEPDTSLQLHDVGVADGKVTIFYSVDRPQAGASDPLTDSVYALDVVTGKATKITDAGGWESGVELNFGGGVLVGLLSAEAQVAPFSVDMSGLQDVVNTQLVGLKDVYSDDPAAPWALTISANGDRLSWVAPVMTEDGGNLVGHEVTIAPTDGSEPLTITLPAGPTLMNDIVDYGDYLLLDTNRFGDIQATSGTLVDPATRGILVLPVAGPAAASGRWSEPPRWAIPSTVNESVTEEIKALEPQWADGRDDFDYAKALADLLVGDDVDATDECASLARTFPNTGIGDGPFYIELRESCDDSVAGAWYEVTIVGPQPDGSLTGGASRRVLCWRGVTDDGICV
jgi:hypothetical protein